LPQGLPKKIQFHLLLADLAFQRADPFARRRKVVARLSIEHPKTLARSTRRPQRLNPTPAVMPQPPVQLAGPNLQLARKPRCRLSRHHPLYRRDLERSAEYTPSSL
jgi:hypothetical protein